MRFHIVQTKEDTHNRIEIRWEKMHKEFLMGNEAIALGAMAAGVNVVSGYPGDCQTE